MSDKNNPVQTIAIPYGWQEGELHLGIVTAHRSRNWTLPKASVKPQADAGEAASNEALRQGGFIGLSAESPLLTTLTSKGTELRYFPVEISGILDTWDANRYQSRKLVPMSKREKYLTDRTARQAVRLLLEQLEESTLAESPQPAE